MKLISGLGRTVFRLVAGALLLGMMLWGALAVYYSDLASVDASDGAERRLHRRDDARAAPGPPASLGPSWGSSSSSPVSWRGG